MKRLDVLGGIAIALITAAVIWFTIAVWKNRHAVNSVHNPIPANPDEMRALYPDSRVLPLQIVFLKSEGGTDQFHKAPTLKVDIQIAIASVFFERWANVQIVANEHIVSEKDYTVDSTDASLRRLALEHEFAPLMDGGVVVFVPHVFQEQAGDKVTFKQTDRGFWLDDRDGTRIVVVPYTPMGFNPVPGNPPLLPSGANGTELTLAHELTHLLTFAGHVFPKGESNNILEEDINGLTVETATLTEGQVRAIRKFIDSSGW